jgi:hydroxymethylpyrimidine/phosphomethylpyrimidine kinase
MSILDIEPFFKTGPAPKIEVISALRKDILPFINILSATVPEVKALLNEAGILIDYPKSIQDVLSMANALRSLGPKYVIIKREIFEEGDGTTTLHFVLCGDTEPLIVTSRCENPKKLFGVSYSIPRK